MARKIGRTRNLNDTSTISAAIALNTSTSTKIVDANGNRMFVSITNDSINNIWIKLQAASVDNNKTGIKLRRRSVWEMPVDNMYTGEISAISEAGTPDVFITEY